ncbi:glycosyltransferase [Gordonia polyisoprenivorans]|uniref:glycosyltransferase n=1 Tax=Gordonia polyisoprenivorans TaxID=84595 RepID=UPI002233EF2A|nr:glycosyltransferase [Gordonia polyisoprenivorans]
MPNASHSSHDSDRVAIDRVVVVIPAHNERDLLPACLRAVRIAADAVRIPVHVGVVLDTCTDGSAEVIGAEVAPIVGEFGAVGAARAAGIAALLHDASSETDPERTWVATTDADSEVPGNWLQHHLMRAADGADAYAGTVTPKDWTRWPAALADRYRRRYRDHDGHRHIHGANLGVRADAYLAVGGFGELPHDEDVDLIERLESAGVSIAWCAQAPVATSTRRHGRAPEGFAAHLRSLSTTGRRSA